MTADDIRDTYSMTDVVERYGLHPDRAGFLNCPFHVGDHTASLKLYKKDFHCFGCHAHGDVIRFVMLMDNCSWKDAFKSLGGETGRLSDAAIMRIAKRKREAQRHRERLENGLKETRYASSELLYAKMVSKEMEPFSDAWCAVQNMIPVLERNADEALNKYQDIISEGR